MELISKTPVGMNNAVKEVHTMMMSAKEFVLESMKHKSADSIFVDIKGFKYLISWQGFLSDDDDEDDPRYYVVELIRYKRGKGRINFTKTQGEYLALRGWRRTAGEQVQFRFLVSSDINI